MNKPIFIHLAAFTLLLLVYAIHATAAQSFAPAEWHELNRLSFIYIAFVAIYNVYQLKVRG